MKLDDLNLTIIDTRLLNNLNKSMKKPMGDTVVDQF